MKKILELQLIDIENLVGSPIPTQDQAQSVEAEIGRLLQSDVSTQCVIACNHLAASCLFGYMSATRRILKSGPNGADLALLDSIDAETISERYSRVVIGSGDNIFAPIARYLVNQGVEVIVISRPESLGKALSLVATEVLLISQPISPNADEMRLAA